MCYSAEVSFATWGFGMLCAAVLAFSGTPIRSFLFPLIVTQMQLIEGLRWTNAVDERILAIAGKLELYLQPIAAMIEGQAATHWIALYAVAQGLMELLYGSRDLTFKVQCDGHFKWNWIHKNGEYVAIPYLIALFVSTMMLFPVWVWASAWALLGYYTAEHWRFGTQGSLWCVAANLLWVYYLLR